MRTASESSAKWQSRASGASQDYLKGAQSTTKDQSALAIAAKGNWKAGLDAAFANGTFEKGLQRSGKEGWLVGVTQKGAANYGTGVQAPNSKSKYETNSGRYDAARSAAASIARQPKGNPGNLQRVAAVVTAERAVKTGK